jgi:two-component system, chemotaxis family, sensor kinase CheA
MTVPGRLQNLLDSLGMEILTAQAGSDAGQFPILDLLGNLRDESVAEADLAGLHARCAGAWERVVRIVESGQPFTDEEIAWLNNLLGEIQALVETGGKAQFAQTPLATPSAPSVVAAAGEELALDLSVADDGDLLREFINESREHLDRIEQGVLVLEKDPADAETLNTVFRAFHTFKGGAGFLNLLPINRLAHVLESLLDLARQRRLAIDRAVIDLILRGRDVLKQFLDQIEGQMSGTRPAATILIPTAALKADVERVIAEASAGRAAVGQMAPVASDASNQHFPPNLPQTPESAISPAVGPATPPVVDAPAATARPAELAATVKVDTGKLDVLLDLVGELVIAQSLVTQDFNRLSVPSPQLARNMAQLGRITKDVQRISQSMRMMPIRGAFQKMTRVVRDIAAKQNKTVQLLTSGDETELDRGVVEESRHRAGGRPAGARQTRAGHHSIARPA